jgi:hypothetical protein
MHRVMSAALACCATCCASSQDAASRQVIGITHLTTQPAGTVSVSDDRTYSFLGKSGKPQVDGTLSTEEFATLSSHVVDLRALYQKATMDSDACSRESDSYILLANAGTACFVVRSVSDAGPLATLQYFVDLYNLKAPKP